MALVPVREDTFIAENVLKDTFSLTKTEALSVQKTLIDEWEPAREVWALKYGSYCIGITCAVSSLMVNSLFRRKLKLRSAGRYVSGISLMVGPGVLASIAYDMIITDDILLYHNKCPICYEVKASLLVNTCGILHPLVLSPALNLGLAGSMGLRIPQITEVKELAKFWWSAVKPALNHLSIALCINSILAGVLVYSQFSSTNTIANIVQQVEKYKETGST